MYSKEILDLFFIILLIGSILLSVGWVVEMGFSCIFKFKFMKYKLELYRGN